MKTAKSRLHIIRLVAAICLLVAGVFIATRGGAQPNPELLLTPACIFFASSLIMLGFSLG